MSATPIREDGVAGSFGCPDGPGPFPGVVALGGSDGGTPEYFLNLLVPEGFACLALTYWGASDTQPGLSGVPVERVERGLRWLASRPEVTTRNGRLSIVGASKGAELALVVASTFPDLVGPVVGYTPSSVVWAAINLTPGPEHSSWTHGGEPFPFLPFPSGVTPAWSDRGFSMLPVCEKGLDNTDAVARAEIAVERATGPLLLVSGGDDRVWAAGRMSDMIVARMTRLGRAGAVKHLHYPEAGHMLFPYTRPADSSVPPWPFDHGGSPEADAAAHAAAWKEVVGHLKGKE